MVLAVAWPLACGGGDGGGEFDGPLTYVRGGGETGQARTLIVRPDGTGSVQLEHGIDDPERVTLRLTAQERDRLARLVGAVDLGAIEEDDSRADPGRLRLFGAPRRRGGRLAVRRAPAGARGALGASWRRWRRSTGLSPRSARRTRSASPAAPARGAGSGRSCSRPSGRCGRGNGSRTRRSRSSCRPSGLRTFARSARRIAAARLRPSRLESLKLLRAILPRPSRSIFIDSSMPAIPPDFEYWIEPPQHRRGGADGSDGEPHQGQSDEDG